MPKWKTTEFADLPVTRDVTWDQAGKGRPTLENEVLGDPPDWQRYKRAFLVWDEENPETKAGYKLMVARMENGRLQVVWNQLVSRVAILNGAREGVEIPDDVARSAFAHAMKYYEKAGVGKDDQPKFSGSTATTTTMAVGMHVALQYSDKDEENGNGADDLPRWVQIATEGRYLGYKGGAQPFAFTRETFEQIIRNFRRNPAYKQDANGVGCEGVVPWDFGHASEAEPTAGTVPIGGVPAQGWACELGLRNGARGEAQLWALTRFLEPARSYIRNEQYKWASVSVLFNAVDPRTGEAVGAVLTSVALTNTPFIEGMQRLAASRYFYESAGTAAEAVEYLKRLFQLSEMAGVAELMVELTRLNQWLTTGAIPLGVDVPGIVAGMRQILNLPALEPEASVLANALGIVNRLLGEQAIGTGGAPSPTEPSEIISTQGGNDMTVLAQLAKLLGVRETEADVTAAVEDAVDLRKTMATVLAAKKQTNQALGEALSEALGAKEKLAVLYKAIGVEDPDKAVAVVADLVTRAAELERVMPELSELRKGVEEQRKRCETEDVAAAMSTYKLPESTRVALTMFRQKSPAEFAAKFPAVTPDRVVLTQHVTTDGGQPLPVGSKEQQPAAQQPNGVDLSLYSGANRVERAIEHIRATRADAAEMPWEELFKAGARLAKQTGVKDR